MLHNCGHRSTSAYPCSCGFLCGAGGCGGAAATLSFLFPSSGKPLLGEAFDAASSTTSSYSSSSVDCTLSLGTPSTRRTEHEAASSQIQRRSCVSNFCWDIISQTKNSSPTVASDGGVPGGSLSEGDPLLVARRCANCDTTSTPLWRNGPRGPKSLCNACGIRYKKEERRAAGSTVPPSSSFPAAVEQGISYGYHRQPPSAWSCYAAGSMRSSSSITVYDEKALDGDVSCLSWRLNVVPSAQFQVRERHTLFQYN